VGERIAAILDAAESSAEAIRVKARDEAAEILRHAHATGASRVAELTREPERIRDEAAAAAAETRRAADQDAARMRRGAEAEVRRIDKEGRDRERELEGEIEALTKVRGEAVDAVRSAADGLREAARRLDTLLSARVAEPEHGQATRRWSFLRRRDGAPPSPAAELHERAKAAVNDREPDPALEEAPVSGD
jgi:hypothetical protein